MAIKDYPRHKEIPVRRPGGTQPEAVAPSAVGKFAAVARIVVGLVFAWAFLDKMFGLGYATAGENAWVNGGSPTQGFLGHLDHGPLADVFRGWAGAWWADWLFMLGLAGVGLALLFGIGLRVAAVAGTLMMLLMWAAEWPLDRLTDAGAPTMSTNPIIDYHIVYAVVLIGLALVAAGDTWGLGRTWANLGVVRKNPWLR